MSENSGPDAWVRLARYLNNEPGSLEWLKIYLLAVDCDLSKSQRLALDYMCEHNFGIFGGAVGYICHTDDVSAAALGIPHVSREIHAQRYLMPLETVLGDIGRYLESREMGAK